MAADSGAINGTWNGSAAGGTLSGAYVDGTAILLTATLPPGTVVSSWGTGCDSTTATTCSISSLTTNTTISPVFAPDTRSLTVNPSGPTYSNGSVTIAADSGAINGTWNGSATGGTLAGDYIKGAAIVLTATLPAGTVVSSWGAGCDSTTATTCTLNAGTLTSNTTISPVFALDTRTLTVSPSGPTYSNGSVTIAADSGAISGTWDGSAAGGTLSDTYNYGTAVVLTATLPAGTVVSSWGAGCDSTTATTCTLNAGTLTSNTTISPVFEVDAKSLTVSPSGPTYSNGSVTIAADSGAISGTWDGSAAGGTFSDTYNYGTAVVLTATLPTGTVVSSWGAGCDATTATTCTLNAGTLTSNTTISPVFEVDAKSLTVSPSGPTYSNGSVTIAADSGAISGTWDGSAIGGTLSDTYNYGTGVVLTATLPTGTVVSSWGAGCDATTATTCTLNAGTLTSNTTISPVFALDTRSLTVSPSGPTYSNGSVTIAADSGAISGTWDGSVAGGILSDTYNYGTAVVLTATLPTGTVVSSWGAGCDATTATTCTLNAGTLTSNTTIAPVFALDTRTLTVSPSGPTYSNDSVTIAADSGAISGTWDGSAIGGTLSDTYNYGTAVVLTATLPTGTVISSWGAGCDATTATTCTLNAGTLTSNTTIAPVFALDTRTLTVNPSGPTYSNGLVTIAADSGVISGTWDGSAIGGTLSDTYDYGAAIVLTATLPAGTVVSSWGAGCDSTAATTCTLNAGTLTSDTTIAPVFALDTRTLTVSPSGPTYSNGLVTIAADSGAISGTWDGSASGGTLSDTYNYGTAIVLTATLPASTVVSSWGAGCNSTTATTCTITNLTTNMTISPAFAVNNDPTFTGTPTITGIAKVGKTLSLVDTLTNDIDGDIVTLSYQWAADGVDILGATSDTYALTINEVQKNVTCTLTADDGNGGDAKFTTVGVDVGNSFPWPMFLPAITK